MNKEDIDSLPTEIIILVSKLNIKKNQIDICEKFLSGFSKDKLVQLVRKKRLEEERIVRIQKGEVRDLMIEEFEKKVNNINRMIMRTENKIKKILMEFPNFQNVKDIDVLIQKIEESFPESPINKSETEIKSKLRKLEFFQKQNLKICIFCLSKVDRVKITNQIDKYNKDLIQIVEKKNKINQNELQVKNLQDLVKKLRNSKIALEETKIELRNWVELK